jgi:HD-GYP domain-containing protein (c-di-GMP phosphodiesterase class II)
MIRQMRLRRPALHTVPLFALAGALAAFPLGALHFFSREEVQFSGNVHFSGVGLTALVAALAAVALTIVGARRQDARTVLVGTAFSAMAALLALHGIATPGMLVGPNGVVSFTGGATLPIGGAVLALSAMPALRRPRGVKPLLFLQAGLLAVIVALGAIGLLVPEAVPAVPEPRSAPALALLAVGLVFYGVLGLRALRTFLLTRRRADLLVFVGIVWLAAALPPAMMLQYFELGWWLGHWFELVGIAIVGVPVALDLHRGAQSRPLAGDLSGAELVASEEAFLGAHVRALTVSLAEKDEYTECHTRRVALRAVQVGEELGLSAIRLRALATGALVHDIGKLTVPDSVLKKPGPLTDEEFAVIKRHPDAGDRLLADLGFGRDVRQLVRDHHERLDGNGYPNGLFGPAISLDVRILTVCDVYDALISTRVYRGAWSHDRALALLREESGMAFDSRCVTALERVLAIERGPVLVAV